MKLRNKRTGDIWGIPKMRYPTMQEDDISFFAYGKGEGCLFSYHSLADLNKEWEDYKPTEPLIEDEKIRKAVRAWAEANGDDGETWLEYYYDDNRLSTDSDCIEFNCFTPFRKLKDGATYTINELCGEEK